MWILTMFQKKYQELEFEFDDIESAAKFMDKASAHSSDDIEFHLIRKDGDS